MSNFKLQTQKQLVAAIAAMVVHKASYVQAVQDCAVQCIGHAVKHGDVTLATDLANGVRAHDKHIVVAFMEQNGPFAWDKEKGFTKNRNWKGTFVPENIPHWETAKRVPEVKSMFDVDEALDKFLANCHAQQKKVKSFKNAELITLIEGVQASFNSKRLADESARILAKAVTNAEVEAEKVTIAPVALAA